MKPLAWLKYWLDLAPHPEGRSLSYKGSPLYADLKRKAREARPTADGTRPPPPRGGSGVKPNPPPFGTIVHLMPDQKPFSYWATRCELCNGSRKIWEGKLWAACPHCHGEGNEPAPPPGAPPRWHYPSNDRFTIVRDGNPPVARVVTVREAANRLTHDLNAFIDAAVKDWPDFTPTPMQAAVADALANDPPRVPRFAVVDEVEPPALTLDDFTVGDCVRYKGSRPHLLVTGTANGWVQVIYVVSGNPLRSEYRPEQLEIVSRVKADA